MHPTETPKGVFYRLLHAQGRAVDFLNHHADCDRSAGTPCLAMLTRSLGLAQGVLYRHAERTDTESVARSKAMNAGYIAVYLAEYCAKEGIDLAAAIEAAEADRETRAAPATPTPA